MNNMNCSKWAGLDSPNEHTYTLSGCQTYWLFHGSVPYFRCTFKYICGRSRYNNYKLYHKRLWGSAGSLGTRGRIVRAGWCTAVKVDSLWAVVIELSRRTNVRECGDIVDIIPSHTNAVTANATLVFGTPLNRRRRLKSPPVQRMPYTGVVGGVDNIAHQNETGVIDM